MKIEIKHRYTENVLFACEAENMLEAVLQAIAEKANLRFADLSFANLRFADLRFADLRFADLRFADLSSADLRFADLRFANLRFADLSFANLRFADLSSADLRFADLRGEVLAISPLFINEFYWNVTITESFLTIGCKRFEHKEWAEFDDETIKKMDGNASDFWSVNKSWLLLACESHKEQSLKFRMENM